jgi:DNA-binding IclR family transcriptional regulator
VQIRNKSFTKRNLAIITGNNHTLIRSVHRAVNILTCLGDGTNTLTDIAIATKLAKPTVYRLLKTLEELHMVTYDPVSRWYYLGPLVTKLASNPKTNHYDLITCALEEIKTLWELTGENVELNIMVGSQYDRLYEIMGKHKLKVYEGADPVGPVFVGSAAKVLLSQLDDKELRLVLKNINIKQVTEYSVTDKKLLLVQIREARQQGYAVSYGERIAGALCISAPVKSYFWPVALSLVGPESRLTLGVTDLIKKVISSARRITKNIEEFYRGKEVINSEQLRRK